MVARIACAAGALPEDIAQISFGYGLFTGALGLHFGLEKVGATVIPASSGNSEKQLMMMRDFGVTGLVATPSYALYLGELVRESPYPKEAYASLKYGILGSEGCTEEMRQRIEENLGVTVTDNYGMTELTGREAYTIHRLLGAAWAAEGDELTFRKNESDPLRCGVRFSGAGTQRDRVAHASAPSGSTT